MDIFKAWFVTRPISHRGLYNADIPENSIAAFKNSVAANYAIELDVRILEDGGVAVFHDECLSRMTGADGYISNVTTANLAELRLNKTDESVPTLEKVLETVNGQVPLLIEIKNSGKIGVLEGKVIDMLKAYAGQTAVQSFNPYSLEYFKLNAPHILRGQLSCFFKDNKELSLLQKFALKRLKANKLSEPDFIAYDVEALPNRWVDKYRGVKPVLAWTVRSNAQMEAAADLCDNIIFEKFIPQLNV